MHGVFLLSCVVSRLDWHAAMMMIIALMYWGKRFCTINRMLIKLLVTRLRVYDNLITKTEKKLMH